jgi:23S rRNA (pseudouridine1915-N3)-methyltransferase
VRICIIAVGKLKERGLRELVDEYLDRVRRHVPCDEIEIRDGRHVQEAMRAAIPSHSHVIALEVNGKEMDSVAFSALLMRCGGTGKGVVSILIGGAEGLPASISREAQQRVSLSKLTMAHRVARVMLAEQVYRATTIWRHEPYHR